MDLRFTDLVRAARKLLHESLELKRHENFLIVADTHQRRSVIEAFYTAAHADGFAVQAIVYPTVDNQREIPRTVVEALKGTDAALLIPTRSFLYTKGMGEVRSAATCPRFLISTDLNEDTLLGVLRIDYGLHKRRCTDLLGLWSKARTVHITSPEGTDLTMSIEGRAVLAHDGVSSEPREEDDIPGGIAFAIPDEYSSEGTVVFDGSIAPPLGVLKSPIHCTVRGGKIVKIEGGDDARRFAAWLAGYNDPSSYHIVELGVGVNPNATLSGVPGPDESIAGVIHLGIGDNTGFPGGRIVGPSHTDAMIMNGAMTVDGREIIRNAQFVY
jgi:leucyl aminopeptidase (aminopeptidase T)